MLPAQFIAMMICLGVTDLTQFIAAQP